MPTLWLALRSRLIAAAAAAVSGAMLVVTLGSPAQAIYAKMSNTLDAPAAIGGSCRPAKASSTSAARPVTSSTCRSTLAT
jgi:hypothetical protein